MCEGKWTEIDPSRVPVRCMAKCKKAFFNNIVGIDNKKRYECATRFSRYCMDMMKGRVRMKCANVLVPHEIIGMSFLHSANADELALLQAQWNSIRDNIRASMKDCRTIAMCDFSESMRGVPVRVSAAMGILLSEVAHPAFRDHILTFDRKPRWFSFHSGQSLAEKVRSLFNSDCGQGDSTNFEAACDLILRKLVENRVPPEEIPNDLVVFTDMGWNAVAGASVTQPTEWNTHFLTLQRKFYDHGYKLPRIIIWNLRAEYKEFHATAQEAGVIMISGWSPSAFRILFDGTLDVIQSDGLIRKILDDPMYDSIRNVLVNAA